MKHLIKIVLLILSLLWIFLFSIKVILPGNEYIQILDPIFEKLFSSVCHQDPNKLCFINKHPLLICARCTGIYLGVVSGIVVSFFMKKTLAVKYLFSAAILMLIDVIFTTTGIYNYSKDLAFLTGLFLGVSLFLYIHDIFLIRKQNWK